MVSEEERLRRAVAERGFWKEMEERGLDRAEVFFTDEHYERLNEIRRGLITSGDIERHERRVLGFMAEARRKEIDEWHAVQQEFENETKEGR